MKLSIIVPVYNMTEGGKLAKCMDSLLHQDLEDYEIIAVDDASTDDSLTYLKSLEAEHPSRLKVVASPCNKRQGGAKNLGLDAATGAWVGFVDSDDWVRPDMYSKLLQRAEETGADVVGCDYIQTDALGKEEGLRVTCNTADQTGSLTTEQYKKLLLKPGSMVIKLYRRALFEEHQIRFPEQMFYEDNAVAALPLLYAKRFERVEEPLYFYYQHSGSTVHRVNISRLEDRMHAGKLLRKECMDRGFYDTFKAEVDYKVFELGYRNTLFSYLQNDAHPKLSFVREMRRFLLEMVPDYEKNPYYRECMDAENQKLIAMHVKSPTVFLLYYMLLKMYRRFRYGQK